MLRIRLILRDRNVNGLSYVILSSIARCLLLEDHLFQQRILLSLSFPIHFFVFDGRTTLSIHISFC